MATPVPKTIDHVQRERPSRHHSVPEKSTFNIEDELNALRQMQDAFITTASHELRTPLTAIVGYSEFLFNQATSETLDIAIQKEMLGIILEKATELESIVETLLDLKRFKMRQSIDLNKKVCCVEDLVVDALRSAQEKNPDHRVTVKLANGMTSVRVDLAKMQQVLIELVANAIKFSSDRLITVQGHISGNCYCLSVQDNGPGMTAEQIDSIFKPFYRVDSSNTAQDGLGLGLSWTKGVVEAHGGQLLVKSEVRRGTQVSMILPMWKEYADTANMDVRS
jgi:signal transduction histidine kinase